jgi:hypothetical protein
MHVNAWFSNWNEYGTLENHAADFVLLNICYSQWTCVMYLIIYYFIKLESVTLFKDFLKSGEGRLLKYWVAMKAGMH